MLARRSNLFRRGWSAPGRVWAVLMGAVWLAVLAMGQSTADLGRSSIELTGPWKFHVGDDPAWAQPGFDDAAWGGMELTPPPGSFDPYIGTSGFVPGWTARGFAGYAGFAWYRLRVNVVEHAQGEKAAGLALKMPDDVDDAYQVYVNGSPIGEFGRFNGKRVSNYIAQPRAFLLPKGIESGPVTIAIRMWMDAHTALVQRAAGGMHGPPVLGQTPAVLAMLRLDWDALNQSAMAGFVEAAILLLAILVGFSLFGLDRTEFAYLWLGVTCAVSLLGVLVGEVVYHTTWLPAVLAVFLRDVVLLPAVMALWIFFWTCWFRLPRARVLRQVAGILVVLEAFGTALERAPLYGHLLPVQALEWVSPLTLALKLLLGAVLFYVAFRGILKDRTEGLLALPAVALVGVAQYQYALQLFRAPIVFFIFGYAVSISEIATLLSLVIITVLLLRRFLESQRMREQWRLEIEQARQVQQLLIPEELPAIPGFALESEYRPAQQVGGDFFQILPGIDGSVLIVIGDVSGKGLRAAMLVSMIVGSIRTLAAFTSEPEVILCGLNERLCGRISHQFATCLALHIAPDGRTIVANAGHLPPFLNGSEVPLAGSIPLGLVESAPVERLSLTLEPGDRMILLTDGIAEARNRQNELFGFERVADLAIENRNSVEIAAAAQAFGQEDDITVLRIERLRVAVPGADDLAASGATKSLDNASCAVP
ncbi:MAG: SpoIIE family protein phosphatase [Acidobacteriota bacterium]